VRAAENSQFPTWPDGKKQPGLKNQGMSNLESVCNSDALTSWVAHSLPVGCPQMTWGRTLENTLKRKGISKEFDEWFAIAKDRAKWRQLTHSDSLQSQTS